LKKLFQILIPFTLILISNIHPLSANGTSPAIGELVPNILLLPLGQKKLFNLRKQKHNGYTIISFSATYCEPCLKEIKEFTNLKNQTGGAKLRIYLVFVDENEIIIQNYRDKHKITLPILHDKFKFASNKFNVSKLPSAFLIDKKGILVYKSTEFNPKTLQEIKSYLE
jgi:peroxiredoxin